MNSKDIFLIIFSSVPVVTLFVLKRPIAQNNNYHIFADNRRIFGLPNGMDVLSNSAFIFTGLSGIAALLTINNGGGHITGFTSYLTFFIGLCLTAFGSAWYHVKPDNKRLVWDRIPMTIAFAGFFCSVLSEVVSAAAGKFLLLPLLMVGVVSVFYWAWSEKKGRGDLRPYVIVQFLPMVLVPVILVFYDTHAAYWPYILWLLLFYALAKMFEYFDELVYSWGNVVSGHTLKHLFAAAGTLSIVEMLRNSF
ncbi:MAG: alkaline phytoceramidase [Deltaproteobacteria bacterium]|nr:alkaline phytoceramidase [Deltaproteobacteria bacterium]